MQVATDVFESLHYIPVSLYCVPNCLMLATVLAGDALRYVISLT